MRGEKFSGHERANALKQGGRRRKWSRRHRASPGGKRPAMRSDLDRIVERIAFWTAMAGGGALIVALVLTVVSLVGRALISAGLGPTPCAFPLVDAGPAFAVLAFLRLCPFPRATAPL